MNQENIEFIAKITNQILQDIFFIVGTVVTTLTYINAKKTVLQPIKTEVFKLQVEKFSFILDILNTKDSMKLKSIFDELLFVNLCLLCDDYAELFFDVEIDRDTRPYNNQFHYIKASSMQEIEKYKEYRIQYNKYLDNKKNNHNNNSEISDEKSKLDLWMKYKYKKIILTTELIDFQKELRDIIKSPLLPNELFNLLEELIEMIRENQDLVEQILNESVKEIPNKYVIHEIINEKSSIFVWIKTRYQNKHKNFQPIIEKIIAYIRNYWLIEKITKS